MAQSYGFHRQGLPWQPMYGLDLGTEYHRKFKKNYSSSVEKFVDLKTLSRLCCHRDDVYDYEDYIDPSYIYVTRFADDGDPRDLLALGNEDGNVIFQDTTDIGSPLDIEHFQAHHNAIFDLAWVPGSRGKIVTVSGDQTIAIWDISRIVTENRIAEVRRFTGHSRSVKCVEFIPGDPNVFVTGSRDNSILVWDARAPCGSKSVNSIRNGHSVQISSRALKKSRRSCVPIVSSCSITALKMQDSNTLISSSDSDGIIKVWDLRKSYDRFRFSPQPKFQFIYPGKCSLNGYSALALDSARANLFACCKDHSIYKYELASYANKPVAVLSGFQHNSKYFNKISVSHDGKYLASGSGDKFACIWNISSHGPTVPVARLGGHEAEVTCLEWSPREHVLVTCGDDLRQLTWRISKASDLASVDKNELAGVPTVDETVNYFQAPFYKTELVPKVKEEDKPSVKRKIFESTENKDNIKNQLSAAESSRVSFDKYPCSPGPVNFSPAKSSLASPRKLMLSPRKQAVFCSPTACLPNLVADENRSPSSASKKKQHRDWLTSLSRQRRQLLNSTQSNSPKRKLDPSNPSPRTKFAKLQE